MYVFIDESELSEEYIACKMIFFFCDHFLRAYEKGLSPLFPKNTPFFSLPYGVVIMNKAACEHSVTRDRTTESRLNSNY